MKTVGIVAEFNPFHNGHKYLIDSARQMGAENIIIAMSGDFVQSGDISFMSKEAKTKAALLCGADMVVSLPVYFSTASAEFFAHGAISIFKNIGIDSIIFGAETDDIEGIKKIAGILANEPFEYSELLNQFLKNGDTYPRARQKAISVYTGDETLSEILSSPNNILGIEYCKAIIALNANIEAFAIKRAGASYHETTLANEVCSSATALRELYNNTNSYIDSISDYVPEEILPLYKDEYKKSYPVTVNDIMPYLLPRLLMYEFSDSDIFDMTTELKNRIIKMSDFPAEHDALIKEIKTKNETYGHISRALCHLLLDIKDLKTKECPYIRILGIKADKTVLLSMINSNSAVPVITKTAEAERLLSDIPIGLDIYEIDKKAYKLFNFILKTKYGTEFIPEESKKLIKL